MAFYIVHCILHLFSPVKYIVLIFTLVFFQNCTKCIFDHKTVQIRSSLLGPDRRVNNRPLAALKPTHHQRTTPVSSASATAQKHTHNNTLQLWHWHNRAINKRQDDKNEVWWKPYGTLQWVGLSGCFMMDLIRFICTSASHETYSGHRNSPGKKT